MAIPTPADIAQSLRTWGEANIPWATALADTLQAKFLLMMGWGHYYSGRLAYFGTHVPGTTYPQGSWVISGATGYIANTETATSPPGAAWDLAPAGGSGAPTTAQYLTLAADAGLSNERVFTPGTGLLAVDSGAGAAYTVSFGFAGEADGDLAIRTGGTWARLTKSTDGKVLTLTGGIPAWESLPTIPTGGGSVQAETSYGLASNAGSAGTWSKSDHTHGTPALPTPGDIGALADTSVGITIYDTPGTDNWTVPNCHSIRVDMWGQGGGGGAGRGGAAGSQRSGGGAGGAGAHVWWEFTPDELGGVGAVVVVYRPPLALGATGIAGSGSAGADGATATITAGGLVRSVFGGGGGAGGTTASTNIGGSGAGGGSAGATGSTTGGLPLTTAGDTDGWHGAGGGSGANGGRATQGGGGGAGYSTSGARTGGGSLFSGAGGGAGGGVSNTNTEGAGGAGGAHAEHVVGGGAAGGAVGGANGTNGTDFGEGGGGGGGNASGDGGDGGDGGVAAGGGGGGGGTGNGGDGGDGGSAKIVFKWI